MYKGSNQALAVDATSVASSFSTYTLKLNFAQINRLPDNILKQILSNVERMLPNIQKFLNLRSVETRWRSIIDNICKEKKSLVLIIREWNSSTNVQTEDIFFGLLDETDFMRVKIQLLFVYDAEDGATSNGGHVSILGSFPNIEQLYIYSPDSRAIDRQITNYINSLGSLKKLYLDGHFESIFYFFWGFTSTLSKFELFFFNSHSIYSRIQYVRVVAIYFDYVLQLHARNPRWLDNVTQLSFTVGLNDQSDQIVNFLREHAALLNVLYIKFCDTSLITPELFGHLGKLTRLTEIAIGPVQFEVLKQAAKAIEHNKFQPLSTITTCNLAILDFDYHSVTVDQFAGVLLAIFPRVVNWKLAFVLSGEDWSIWLYWIKYRIPCDPESGTMNPEEDKFITQLKQNLNFSCNTHPNIRECKITIDVALDHFFDSLNNSSSF